MAAQSSSSAAANMVAPSEPNIEVRWSDRLGSLPPDCYVSGTDVYRKKPKSASGASKQTEINFGHALNKIQEYAASYPKGIRDAPIKGREHTIAYRTADDFVSTLRNASTSEEAHFKMGTSLQYVKMMGTALNGLSPGTALVIRNKAVPPAWVGRMRDEGELEKERKSWAAGGGSRETEAAQPKDESSTDWWTYRGGGSRETEAPWHRQYWWEANYQWQDESDWYAEGKHGVGYKASGTTDFCAKCSPEPIAFNGWLTDYYHGTYVEKNGLGRNRLASTR